jgi:hypothetical protein
MASGRTTFTAAWNCEMASRPKKDRCRLKSPEPRSGWGREWGGGGRTIDSGSGLRTRKRGDRGLLDLAEAAVEVRECTKRGSPKPKSRQTFQSAFRGLPGGFHSPLTVFAKGARPSPARSYCE